MKYVLFIVLALIVDPVKIGKINQAKQKAKEFFERGDYQAAAAQYRVLIDSLGVKEDEVTMNLAHALFQLNDSIQAQNAYMSLASSANPRIRSVSHQQLGVVNNRQGKFEEALNHFKNSLKADPSNEAARYNYEMLKKKLEEQKKQEQEQKDKNQQQDKDQNKDQKDKDNQDKKDQQNKDQQNKDQEKKDQENKDQKNKDQQDKEQQKQQQQKDEEEKNSEKKEQETPPSVSEKLKEMKISEEKARMVLEALKNQEIQYLQQNKRKATKPKSKGKPDW